MQSAFNPNSYNSEMDPNNIKNNWVGKLNDYNKWIDQGKYSYNSEKLKNAINELLQIIPLMSDEINKYAIKGDFYNKEIITGVRNDMEQTCSRFNIMYNQNKAPFAFNSYFNGNTRRYNNDYNSQNIFEEKKYVPFTNYSKSDNDFSDYGEKIKNGLFKFGHAIKKGAEKGFKATKKGVIKGYNFAKEKITGEPNYNYNDDYNPNKNQEYSYERNNGVSNYGENYNYQQYSNSRANNNNNNDNNSNLYNNYDNNYVNYNKDNLTADDIYGRNIFKNNNNSNNNNNNMSSQNYNYYDNK